jgi:hypothetical protein
MVLQLKSKRLLRAIVFSGMLWFVLYGSGLPASAETEAEGNLLINPGFEESEDGIRAHPWRASQAWGGLTKRTTEAARTGDYGVSIETGVNNNPWVSQLIPVEEGATYRLQAWFRSTAGATGRTAFKLEYYANATPSLQSFVGDYAWNESSAKMNGQWHQMEAVHVAPEGAQYALFYVRLNGTGKVYFDDTAVTKIQDRQRIRVHTDEVFYYPERTEATIVAEIVPPSGGYANYRVDIQLFDEQDTMVWSEMNVAAAAQVGASFNPALVMTDIQAPYEATVVLRDPLGAELERQVRTIYRWERPTTIPEHGIIQVDGQPFFPVIAYHAPVSTFSYLKEIGVNTVQANATSSVSAITERLNAAEQHGLKVLVPFYNNMKVTENYPFIRTAVPAIKNHPALLGYMIMDEPTYNGIGQEELLGAYEIIRSLDQDHPTYMVENQRTAFESTGQATDILVSDLYPFRPNEVLPIRRVGDDIREAIEAVRGDKPVWNILQTFRTGTWSYLPTIEEVRNMGHQSFLAGAKGIGFYSITDPDWLLKDSILWPGLTAFKEEIDLMRELLLYGNRTHTTIGEHVQWGIWTKADEQFAIVINTSSEQRQATLPLGQAASVVEQIYGGTTGTYEVLLPELEVTLAPMQTIVYRIVPKEEESLSMADTIALLQGAGEINPVLAGHLHYRISIIALLMQQGEDVQATVYIEDLIRYIRDPSLAAQGLITTKATRQLEEKAGELLRQLNA